MHEIYTKAVELACKHNIKQLSNYLLYNTDDDTPNELYLRLELNINLCDNFKINIYSFPMKYHPINDPKYFDNRNFIGKSWNRKYIRAIQAILNATKGKIGKGRSFFEAAFGKNIDEFNTLLLMPETFIIERYKYNNEAYEEYRNNGGKIIILESDIEKYGKMANKWKDKYYSLSIERRTIANSIIFDNIFTNEVYKNFKIDNEIRDLLSYYETKRCLMRK